MRSEAELKEFFRRELLPELRAYERRRKATLQGLWHWSVAAVAALTLVAALVLRQPLLLVLAVGYALVRWAWLTAAIRRDLKRNLVSRVLAFWSPELAYRPDGFVSEAEFRQSGLFPDGWSRYGGEDLVTGRRGATAFCFSELRVLKKRPKGEDTMVFAGVFFVADFNKTFRGRTVLLPDVAERTLGVFGRAFQQLQSVAGGQLVTLEDPEFERLFKVYATDATEARYLLTPTLMERLVRLRRSAGTGMRVGFAADRVYVAFSPPTNLFELAPTRSAIGEEAMRTWIGQLELVTGLVDELDLNTRIWSKGASPEPVARSA